MTVPVWTRLARADLAGIDDHYAITSPAHADLTGRAAVAAGHFLAAYPAAGPIMADGLRKWRVNGTNYVIVYRIVAAGIEILRVRHVRENWR